jgi:hypothetical protein
MANSNWIAVDLDGTLAEYHGFIAGDFIGEPIPTMLARVKQWLAEGHHVIIFTARMSHPNAEAEGVEAAVKAWTLKHLGVELDVSCIKDYRVNEFWDDRSIAVESNTGNVIKWANDGEGSFLVDSDWDYGLAGE